MIKKQLLWYSCSCQIISTFWKILIVSSYFFPVEYEKRGRHLWKGKEKCCLGFVACLLICWGDDNINVWKKSPPHALMEWDSKEEIKAGKEGVHDRSEFHQEVPCNTQLNKSQNNLEILCTAVVGPDVDWNKGDGWVRKGGWVGRSRK